MFGDRRKLLMGGGIVAVLVLAIWMMWPASPAPSAAVPTAPARSAQQAGRPAGAAPVAPVKLDALTSARQQPSGTERNPFRYQPKPAPPPPKPAMPVPTVTEAPRPPVPTGPPPPPPIPLKFIGILERANGEKWAVLSDGKATMHGRDGDIVDGRYRIVKIGAESIELTYADGKGRQVVRLTGQ
jgi:hypothetical protein